MHHLFFIAQNLIVAMHYRQFKRGVFLDENQFSTFFCYKILINTIQNINNHQTNLKHLNIIEKNKNNQNKTQYLF